jgi:Tol biopolymer transport system component
VAPTWSPQSTNRIAWSNGQLDRLDIWTMRPDGTGKTRLTSGSDLSAGAAWRSDGTIAFARLVKNTFRFEIWTMTSAGKSQTKVISSVRSNLQPTWLQDGRLVFTSNRDADQGFDLFRAVKGTAGWSQERVTGAPGHELSPNG